MHTQFDANGLTLSVKDNGIGIPKEQLDRIFDRFTQVEGSSTRRYEGSGIGLALVKEIVTQHGGSITVESEAGHGSVFTIVLPRGHTTPDDIAELEEDETQMPVFPEAVNTSEKSSHLPRTTILC